MISEEMKMIREIRDKNSEMHLNMTTEERRKKLDKSTEWFLRKMNKPIRIVEVNKSK